MPFIKKLAKPSLLGLAAGVALAAPQFAEAQSIRLALSGSSALQGDYRPASYRPGALPQFVEANAVGGYKSLGDAEGVLLYVGVTITDDTGLTETTNDVQVRFVRSGPNRGNILIEVRSDSGLGVRNVANNARITGFPAGTVAAPDSDAAAAGDFTDAEADTAIRNAAAAAGGIPIQAGLSDVTADSVARFAVLGAEGGSAAASSPFPTSGAGRVLTANLAGLESFDVGVITLLMLFNSNVDVAGGVNITRTGALNAFAGTTPVIAWNRLNPGSPANAVEAYFREAPSGTRLTFLLDVLQNIQPFGYRENRFTGIVQGPTSGGTTGGVQSGTGNILNAVNNNPNALSYSFVTGNAGNNRANSRVARYNGVLPFVGSATSSPGLPVSEGNTAQFGGIVYGDANPYPRVSDGQYELWTFAKLFRKPGLPTNGSAFLVTESLVDLLQNGPAAFVHRQGLIQPGEMLVTRSGFTSGIVSGEFVNDGGLIIDVASPQAEAALRQ